jgi:tetratricopeptide (TPR) repeat protein
MSSINRFAILPYLLVTVVLAACSAPMPVPPSATTPAPAEPASTPTVAGPEPSKALKKQFATAVEAMQGGKDEQAITLFTIIAKQNPQLASPYTNLGILFFRQKNLAEAEAALKNALQRDGKDYVAANYLGMTYRAMGRFAEARVAYEQALAAKLDYAYAHLNLAILYDLYLGDLTMALDQYQQYQNLVGDTDPQLAGWLADLKQRMKQPGDISKP